MLAVKRLLSSGRGQSRRCRAGGGRRTRTTTARAREPCAAVAVASDLEAPGRPRTRLAASAQHGMNDDQEDTSSSQELIRKHTPGRFGRNAYFSPEDQALINAEDAEFEEDARLRQTSAKQAITSDKQTTMAELMLTAYEEIEDDWISHVLPGNIYRVLAFHGIFRDKCAECKGRGMFNREDCLCEACDGTGKVERFSTDWFKSLMKLIATLLIVLIQWLAPPYLFFAQVYDWKTGTSMEVDGYVDVGAWELSASELRDMPFTKSLQFLFIALFILNAMWVLVDDHETFNQMDHLWDYLNCLTDINFTGEYWLWLGSLTHCWLVIWSVLAHFILIGKCDDFKDVVFDSLGMLFLYNLDDIGADLGFLEDDDWYGGQLKWMYDNIVVTKWPEDREVDDEKDDHAMTNVCRCAFWFTRVFTLVCFCVLPVLSLVTPWAAVVTSPGE